MDYATLVSILAFTLSVGIGIYIWQYQSQTAIQLADLKDKYNKLMLEYWRVIGENQWLRQQLRYHGIPIPQLPEELRPQMDKNGNITISLSQVGQDANVDQLAVGRNISEQK